MLLCPITLNISFSVAEPMTEKFVPGPVRIFKAETRTLALLLVSCFVTSGVGITVTVSKGLDT